MPESSIGPRGDHTTRESRELQELRRCLRDLVALTALSTLWVGVHAEAIADNLADVLVNTLQLEFVSVRFHATGNPDRELATAMQSNRRLFDVADLEAIQAAMPALHPRAPVPLAPVSIPNPAGTGMVRIVATHVGFDATAGLVIAGAARADFPTDLERLLLRLGANQASISVDHARLRQVVEAAQSGGSTG